MPLRVASRQEPRRQRTRAALLRAGADLLADRSIESIAVNEIVDQAGVAKGSFFNHFADKSDFADVVASGIREVVEHRVEAANDGISDPAARIAQGVCSFVGFALTERRDARIMLRGWGIAHIDHPLNGGLRADIRTGCELGRFNVAEPDAAVLHVIGACQVLMVSIVEGRLCAADAVRMTREVLAMLLVGLGLTSADAALVSAQASAILSP